MIILLLTILILITFNPTKAIAATLTITYCRQPSSISGTVFLDDNGNKKKDAGEANYTGIISIGLRGSQASFPVTNTNGAYRADNLPQGQYTIAFSGLPAGIRFTYPTSSLIVKVGTNCSVPGTSEGSCSSENIINLNVGVTGNEPAWFQSIGSDMRWDSGFTNIMPADEYASLPGVGGMPGVIFSGATSPSFGQGSASQIPFNWKVGSFEYPDVFIDTHSLIPTSYRFLLETVDRSAIAKKGVADLCSGGTDTTNCTLTPTTLANGVYFINNNLTLNGTGPAPSYTFPAGKNFVILVNGNLNINEKILVPIGSTVVFSVSGSITVNKNVGEAAPSSAAHDLEGLYSADGNFYTAEETAICPSATNKRLNIAGTVIANAGRTGGTFVNRRNLCISNSSFPSVSFIERPDFMLNYPSLVRQTTRAWQEVAP